MTPPRKHTDDASGRRRFFMLRARACFVLIAVLACLPAFAGKPPARVPDSNAEVIDHLPNGYSALEPRANARISLPQIQAMLAAAARTGDSRLATRAEAALARLPSTPFSAEKTKARAFAAQHRHDFADAKMLLNQVLKRDGRDPGARLSLAQILLVQGEIDRARSECASMILGVDAESGELCIAAWALRTSAYDRAGQILDGWLKESTSMPAAKSYALVMRAEAASRAGAKDADQWFRQALAPTPDDVIILAAYARYLRAQHRDREVVELLAKAPDTDGLRLQLALAAHALGLPQANALIAAQGRRYAVAHQVGTQPEMRDEAEYLLLKGDPQGALALAERNFASQRDYEDVSILQRAAVAAGRLDALAPLQAWADSQQLSLPPVEAVR